MKTRWKVFLVFLVLFLAGSKFILHDMSRTSSFLTAAYAGSTDVVEQMLKDGEYVDVKDFKFHATALIYAAQEGHVETVILLLNNHADVNYMDKVGQTALGQAAFNKHVDIVKLLLDHGAKVDDMALKSAAGAPGILQLLQPKQPEKAQTKAN